MAVSILKLPFTIYEKTGIFLLTIALNLYSSLKLEYTCFAIASYFLALAISPFFS